MVSLEGLAGIKCKKTVQGHPNKLPVVMAECFHTNSRDLCAAQVTPGNQFVGETYSVFEELSRHYSNSSVWHHPSFVSRFFLYNA